MKRALLLAVAVSPLFCTISISPVTATTWHVPGDAATIKAGIGLASAGDTVLVACGTYNENNIRLKSGIVLMSETGQADCVTIDAQQLNRVILCRNINSSTRIEGFTITGGYVDVLPDPSESSGGGLLCENGSSPSIVNCTFAGNFARWDGGGVACVVNSAPTFVSCTVTNNEAVNGGSGMRFGEDCPATVTSCDISNNVGTGVWSSASVELIDCTVSGNSSTGVRIQGWGLVGGIQATLTGCTISGNSGSQGAGVFLWGGKTTFTNCTIDNNNANGSGGGVYCLAASVTIIRGSIESNTAGTGGGLYLAPFQPTNSVVGCYKTVFSNNTASAGGPSGFVETDSEMLLQCSVDDLTGFAGGGTITLNNEGCLVPVESTTWGKLKALYR
jgi:hypothetical protein